MKKALLTAAVAIATLTASAQVVDVQGIAPVPVASGVEVNISRISPNGTFAIVSNNADNSLYRVDFSTGAVKKVAENGSALELAFTPAGDHIVFKSATVKDNHLRYYNVNSVELASGKQIELSKPARHCAAYSISDAGVLTLNDNGRVSSRSAAGAKVKTAGKAAVSINRGHLEVALPGGKSSFIDPQGRGSYLWPSVSPDGKKIVYYLSGHGCYVCDLDGSNARALGYLHAPCWLGNDVVVGCRDIDNGTFITESSIVACTLDGREQTLTPASIIGINPSASADGKTISFSTPTGELYLIQLK